MSRESGCLSDLYLADWLVVPFVMIGGKRRGADWDMSVCNLGHDEFGC